MAKLIWQDIEGNTVEYKLKHGVNRIGSVASNDLVLEHESISDVHCEILNYPDETVLRDLDSTNGVLVNGFPVHEVELRSSQNICIGDVELSFRSGASAEPEVKVVSESVAIGKDEVHCKRCGKTTPLAESNQRRVGKIFLYFCPACGSRCETFSPPTAQIKTAPVVKKMFSQSILDAFAYPFRNDGWVMIICGTGFFTILKFLTLGSQWLITKPGMAGTLGLAFVVLLTMFGTGYLYSFLKDVINTSIHGENTPPPWPTITSLGSDIVAPFFQFLAMVLICAAPGLLWLTFGPEAFRIPVALGLFLLGAYYFPMSLVAVAMFDSVLAMNPVPILNSIARVHWHYTIVVVFMLSLLGIRFVGNLGSDFILLSILDETTKYALFAVLAFITELIALYLFIVMARALGVMYDFNRDRLGWV